MRTTDSSVRRNSERRVERMNTWIALAEATRNLSSHDHVRFVFYWIAYEAGYQQDELGSSERERGAFHDERGAFHERLTDHDRGRLQRILRAQEGDAARLLELRQAHPSFWKKPSAEEGITSTEEWEGSFRRRTDRAVEELHEAVRSGIKRKLSGALNGLFRNLNVVRNQIVHGASAGSQSRGQTQVILGARLLAALVPSFRDSIASNLDRDWGEPPFPRVGSARDDKCPPRWLDSVGTHGASRRGQSRA